MANGKIREHLLTLARAITTHVNRSVEPRVNYLEDTITFKLGDVVRMNSLSILYLRWDPKLQGVECHRGDL